MYGYPTARLPESGQCVNSIRVYTSIGASQSLGQVGTWVCQTLRPLFEYTERTALVS
jgi:hypothetical protein